MRCKRNTLTLIFLSAHTNIHSIHTYVVSFVVYGFSSLAFSFYAERPFYVRALLFYDFSFAHRIFLFIFIRFKVRRREGAKKKKSSLWCSKGEGWQAE